MLFDEGDDKMVKTEAFPTIRMKIDRLLKITNEYQFNDLVKAVYCINLCINNRSVLESCLALNACLIEYEEKGSKRIGTYDEFKGFFGKIYDVMKPGIADDYTVEDFGEVQLRYNDKFYRVIIGTGHNNVYACLNFLPTLARNISREEELCLALEYVSGTIDYFIEENKNDGVVEKRFVLPTEILFYKVQKFFKEEVKKYDILELDSLMMSEGTTIEKSHFVCREDNIYPLYNVSLLIDLYDIWENKIDFKEQISVANEGIIDRIYSLFEMDRSRSCSIFAPAMIFPEQKYDSSQRTYTFIAKASRGVVVALNADEYEEGQLEKEIANIEKYHKSGTLHIAETFNRFDKSGLRGIHIPADMPIEYLIYDSFMNPNQMHMSLGEEGKKRKTCTALDVIYYLNFMDDIDELFEYLSYSNEKDYESSFGFGSDAALYFTWKNQGRYIAKGAIIFNMVDVGYDTENEAVVDYFKEELKDYPFHMRDYLFREPFSWKIEKRDFDTYEYTVKHGMGFGGIYLPLPQKNYVFLTNNVEFYKDVKDFGEYRQWIQLLEEIITEGFDSIKCVFEDNKAISNTGIQIAFMPIEYAVHAGHESFLYEDRIYVYSDAQYYSHKWIIRYVVKDINRIYEDIQEAKNRSTEFNILREILIPLLDRMPDLNELFESKRKKVSLEKKKVGVFSASVEYKWDNNVQNFSPEDYHYHEVRKRIANVCYGNMIKPGIYRGQEANQIIRAMQKARNAGIDCYQKGFTTYAPHMSYENFMEIVKQAAGKTFQIALGGAGDPNKHPQIEDILKSCRAYRIIPNMTTSGFLITDNEVGLIKQYCGAVAVSWYSRFMDGKESNQETIDAVERLVKSGCTTNIHYVVSKDTINEAITRLEMDSFPKGVNAVIFILYKPVGNGIIEKVLKNTDSRIERFISLATKVKHPYRVGFDTCFTPALLRWGDTVPAVSIDACEAATFSMYIDSQMNCYPCSFGIWDKSISESMNSKTLREIWQGDKFVAFREQRKEKCSSCRQMELCRGGCRLGIDIDMC